MLIQSGPVSSTVRSDVQITGGPGDTGVPGYREFKTQISHAGLAQSTYFFRETVRLRRPPSRSMTSANITSRVQ